MAASEGPAFATVTVRTTLLPAAAGEEATDELSERSATGFTVVFTVVALLLPGEESFVVLATVASTGTVPLGGMVMTSEMGAASVPDERGPVKLQTTMPALGGAHIQPAPPALTKVPFGGTGKVTVTPPAGDGPALCTVPT